MIKTRRIKNVVILLQSVLSFVVLESTFSPFHIVLGNLLEVCGYSVITDFTSTMFEF